MRSDHRLAALRAALGFLQLPPRAPELRLLHRWLDSWTGLGLIVVGVERQGLRFSLSHIGEDEWRANFMAHPMFAPVRVRGGAHAAAGSAAGGVGGREVDPTSGVTPGAAGGRYVR